MAPEGDFAGGGGGAVFDAPPIEADNLNEMDDGTPPDPESADALYGQEPAVDFGLGPMPGPISEPGPAPGTREYVQEQQKSQQQQQQPQGSQLSVDDLARVAQVLGSMQPQQAQQPQSQPQMSQEELAASLGKFNADPDLADSIVHAETAEQRAKALNTMIDGMYGHVYKVLDAYGQSVQNRMNSSLAPLTEMQRKAERSEFIGNLTQFYPGLKGKEVMVEKVMDGMNGYQPNPNNPWEPYQLVAQQVQAMANSVAPGFNPSAAHNPTQATLPPMASIPSGNGGGGAGGHANRSSGTTPFGGKRHDLKVDIWGDRR